ncbi:hypothetical protein M011DRAFT_471761 [Sporormia fimetaria CBS 119925]|uniref:NAD(P)-binding protein n=1 Tax=Sporormia fimetaria CBS 119925 TaxID=1340428 RepID=A0A6A6UY04_9PLEO|nr:hypothetical protein M011DRAFT_471761 [Sporormia fimetaria CBS 119925]
MVDIEAVVKANSDFARAQHCGYVCVFASATAGIGLATLKRVATMVQLSIFFIVGPDTVESSRIAEGLKESGPSNSYVVVEAELSLMASVDAAVSHVTGSHSKVDIFCIAPKSAAQQGLELTPEGLDTCFAASYYGPLRMISGLLPLLNRAVHPRVLCILNGGKEKPIDEQDIGLEHKANRNMSSLVKHTTLFTSLAFGYLASHDGQKHIRFLHACPGLVQRISTRRPHSLMDFVPSRFKRFVVMSLAESGERYAFMLTSKVCRPGSWRVGSRSDIIPDNATLVRYQMEGWPSRVWILRRAFGTKCWQVDLLQHELHESGPALSPANRPPSM